MTGRLVVPWDQVILTCGEHMLGMVNSDLWVVHHHGERRDIAVPPVWLHAQVETSISLAARLTGTSPGNVPATRYIATPPHCSYEYCYISAGEDISIFIAIDLTVSKDVQW